MSEEEKDFKEIEKFINEFPPKAKERVIKLVKEFDVIVRKDELYANVAIAYIGAKLSYELSKEEQNAPAH